MGQYVCVEKRPQQKGKITEALYIATNQNINERTDVVCPQTAAYVCSIHQQSYSA